MWLTDISKLHKWTCLLQIYEIIILTAYQFPLKCCYRRFCPDCFNLINLHKAWSVCHTSIHLKARQSDRGKHLNRLQLAWQFPSEHIPNQLKILPLHYYTKMIEVTSILIICTAILSQPKYFTENILGWSIQWEYNRCYIFLSEPTKMNIQCFAIESSFFSKYAGTVGVKCCDVPFF